MSMTGTEILKNLLRPLGIYDVDEGYGALELEALGREMDRVYDALIAGEHNIFPQTADEETLGCFEELFPFNPASPGDAQRRGAICALMQVDGCGFSEKELNRTLSGCGITARVQEGTEKFHVTVSFPDRRGQPESFEDMAELQSRIEAILPCHLAVDYDISFFNWRQLESTYRSWQQLEDACPSWSALEVTSE